MSNETIPKQNKTKTYSVTRHIANAVYDRPRAASLELRVGTLRVKGYWMTPP
jgi:hypothetical protein